MQSQPAEEDWQDMDATEPLGGCARTCTFSRSGGGFCYRPEPAAGLHCLTLTLISCSGRVPSPAAALQWPQTGLQASRQDSIRSEVLCDATARSAERQLASRAGQQRTSVTSMILSLLTVAPRNCTMLMWRRLFRMLTCRHSCSHQLLPFGKACLASELARGC